MARALLPCRRSGRRRCCGWRCALALCLLLACACALVRYIPWDHGQRIYIGRSLLPGLSLHRDDCPATRFGMLQLLTSWLAAHKVPYFLTYGSLLGAVREGRIISYTPDLDIAIPALWTDRVQHLFQTELPDCFETGLNGAVADGVNRQVFHIYTRSPTPERMHAASPLLPFLRAEPWIDVYCVLLCHNGRPMEDGVPLRHQGKPTPCDDAVTTGEPGVQYAYIAGLNGAAANSRKAPGATATPAAAAAAGGGSTPSSSEVGLVPHLRTDYIFPLNATGARIDGVAFAAPHRPEMLLEVVYGRDWNLPRDY